MLVVDRLTPQITVSHEGSFMFDPPVFDLRVSDLRAFDSPPCER